MPKEIKSIESIEQAVSLLGGTNETARLLGRRAPQISQWRARHGAFPAELYFLVEALLQERGASARPEVFTFLTTQRPRRRRAKRGRKAARS
jgi:hypothetical protein